MQNSWWHPYTTLLKRILIALLFFSISRILFGLHNRETIHGITFLNFIYGMRFDITMLAIINIPLILLHAFPTHWFYNKSSQKICFWLFMVLNGAGILLNLIDTAWFPFTQKRSTADFFSLITQGDDVKNNLGSYITDYWYILVYWVLILFFIRLMYKKYAQLNLKSPAPSIKVCLIAFPILVGLTIITARGGLQLRPLSIQAAAQAGPPNTIPFTLNTPYTIIKSFGDKKLTDYHYFEKDELNKIFNPHQSFQKNEFNDLNIIVIVLESFSQEFIGLYNNGKGYTPFLDSLIKESYSFPNSYANGKRSIEGIPAIIASIPALSDEPFITSPYGSNKINSLASILTAKKYSSAFFHGGNNGTMGFDNFTKLAEYDKYFGKDEYDGPSEDYDGKWGIFDDSFYQFMIREANKEKQPFHYTFFSLSSHHPYTIPKQYSNKFPKGTQPIHESIGYADNSLRLFFNEAKKQAWFKNTLFVITADHTSSAGNEYYNGRAGIYKIPLLFYSETLKLKAINSSIAQQADILPSVLDLIHFSGNFSAFGNSLFDSSKKHFAVNYMNGSWQIIANNHSLIYDGTKVNGLYDLTLDSLLEHDIQNKNSVLLKENSLLLKAVMQQYNHSLINNSIIAN
jgi:phosphoglycerol transferase MdoB-like AlkP superfamily enzyme